MSKAMVSKDKHLYHLLIRDADVNVIADGPKPTSNSKFQKIKYQELFKFITIMNSKRCNVSYHREIYNLKKYTMRCF